MKRGPLEEIFLGGWVVSFILMLIWLAFLPESTPGSWLLFAGSILFGFAGGLVLGTLIRRWLIRRAFAAQMKRNLSNVHIPGMGEKR